MKKISIYVLVAIIVSAVVSCKKKFGEDGGADVVFKYKNENYANYVAVAYSDKKNRVTGGGRNITNRRLRRPPCH